MTWVYKRTCIHCKKMFTIKDWQSPGIRCKSCRTAVKTRKEMRWTITSK